MSYADNFTVSGPYFKSKDNKRQIVIVVDRNGTKRTINYARWLMECFLGRKLDEELETVDHINSDVNDNRIENLQLLPRSEHSSNDTRRVKLIKLRCAWGNKEFERSPRLLRDKAKKGRSGPFCSKKCGGMYSRMLQLKLIDKLDKQKHIESEYYKKKNASDNNVPFVEIPLEYLCDIFEEEDLC